jgi:hypothetical protein
MSAALPHYIPLNKAAELTGRASVNALRSFIWRYNKTHPSSPIRQIHGKVEQNDLVAALDRLARKRTPFAAVVDGMKSRALRQNA